MQTALKESQMHRRAQLVLDRLCFSAFVGWTEEERAAPQSIFVSLKIDLKGVPNACRSDVLEETICYGKIVSDLDRILSGSTYKLLEHIAAIVESSLEQYHPLVSKYEIIVEKENVPIPVSYSAVKFRLIGEFNEKVCAGTWGK